MKGFDSSTDNNLIKRSIDTVAQNIPGFSLAWGLGKALLGNAIELRQQRALEFIEMIRDEPEVYTRKLLETREFQDAFIYALEDYIRTRIVIKKGVSKRIFEGYATSEDKELFELERFYATLREISVNALQFMKFIAVELEPKRQQRIQDVLKNIDLKKSKLDETTVRLSVDRQQRLSYVFDDWKNHHPEYSQVLVPDLIDPEKPNVQSSTGVYIFNEQFTLNHEALVELAVLGIIQRDRYSQTDPGWSQSPRFVDSWAYTEYGAKFAEFIERNNG